MHLFGCAKDGVDRAGLDTQGTADAGLIIDDSNRTRIGLWGIGLERQKWLAEQVGKFVYACFTSRRAAVDLNFAGCKSRGIREAAGIAALAALGLGQDGIDLIDEGSRFGHS
jgi:hypothetical protein